MSIWYCKIGTLHEIDLPNGADWPMRKAIGQAFADVTGQDDEFCFSGWSAELTESELAVVENREPVRELVANESPEMLRAALAAERERAARLEAERDSLFEESQLRQRARLLAEVELTALRERLRDLIEGLERTHWSSWQTTAHFWKQFEAARTALGGQMSLHVACACRSEYHGMVLIHECEMHAKMRADAADFQWLRDNPEHPHHPYFEDGRWHFPHEVSNAGGFGGGVGLASFDTLHEAIDAAREGK